MMRIMSCPFDVRAVPLDLSDSPLKTGTPSPTLKQSAMSILQIMPPEIVILKDVADQRNGILQVQFTSISALAGTKCRVRCIGACCGERDSDIRPTIEIKVSSVAKDVISRELQGQTFSTSVIDSYIVRRHQQKCIIKCLCAFIPV